MRDSEVIRLIGDSSVEYMRYDCILEELCDWGMMHIAREHSFREIGPKLNALRTEESDA